MKTTLDNMKSAKRWLLRNGKVPHYAQSLRRRKTTDTPEDRAQLVTFDEAERLLQQHQQGGKAAGYALGFALGPDADGGCWQGIDLDHVEQNNLRKLQDELPGYVERSPSGNGVHAIGYGPTFASLNRHEVGIEAYASGRYFTFTGDTLRDQPLSDLSNFVEENLRLQATSRSASWLGNSSTSQDNRNFTAPAPEELADLGDALRFLDPDSRHLYANKVGMALKTIPDDKGKALWLGWAANSQKFDPDVTEEDWRSFKPTATHWRYVFTLAKQAGWDSPRVLTEPTSDPENLFESIEPADFDPDACLPPVIARWVKANSQASGLDAVGYAFAALAVMAAATNRTVRVDLGAGHNVPIIIWSAIVGATGSGKSPAMDAAHAPLSAMNGLEAQRTQEANILWKKGPKGERSSEPPEMRRVRYSADTTTEALTANLAKSDGPRILVHYDEGSGWLNNMGRYSGGPDGDRGTYLSSWLGQRNHMINRVGRGTISVPELGACILFGITPDKIKEGQKEATAEGLLGRTLLCLIKRRSVQQQAVDPDEAALTAANLNYAALIDMLTKVSECEITFSSEALTEFRVLRRQYGDQSVALESMYPGLAAMLAKAGENLGRLAGLFRLCRAPDPADDSRFSLRQKWTVELEDLTLAINLMKVAVDHAACAYTGLLMVDEPTAVAQKCALKILRLGLDNPKLVEAEREHFMKVTAFKQASHPVRAAALDLLNTYHWLIENMTQRNRSGGYRFSDGTCWRVNPKVLDGRFQQLANASAKQAQDALNALGQLRGRGK